MYQSTFTNLTIDETESFPFLSLFFFFFFWIHITFQYLGIVEGKQFKLYLSLTGFQCSDFFLSFLRVSDLPGVSGDQHVVLADFCPKLCSTLFTGDFPQSRLNSACLFNADFCPKLKILHQISLTGNGILVRRVCEPIIRLFLFHCPVRLRHSIDLDFVQQTTGHRVQVAWPSFPYHFNGQSYCLLIQIKKSKWIDLPFLLSVAYHVTKP